MAEYDAKIVEHFREVLKLPEEQTIDIIRNLAQGASSDLYFLQCVRLLKPLTKSHDGNIRIAHTNNNIVENAIVNPGIGKGAYGEVSLSAKGLIYKEITIKKKHPSRMEESVREIFLEVFIQTVLSVDDRFNRRIPRVFHLYRSSKSYTNGFLMYIVMENVPVTLKSFIAKKLEEKPSRQLSIRDISPMFIQLGTLLNDLHEAYGFYHCDLHGGNIMFNEEGALNIIDFGKACFAVNGVTYSLDSRLPCKSWDLLILLTYLLQYNRNMFDENVISIFRHILIAENGIDFYNYAAELASYKYVPIFHTVYPDFIDELWYREEKNALRWNAPLLEPKNFVNFMLEQVDRNVESKSPGRSSSLIRQTPLRNLSASSEKIGGLYRMAKKTSRRSTRKTRKNSRRSQRKSGGGYQTSQQMFDPEVLPPATILAAPSTAPTSTEIRPVLYSTFQTGAGRRTRRNRSRKHGGFNPSVMGGFVANAQAAIVPLALYAVYHTMVPKTGTATLGGLFSSKATRKNRRASRK